MNQLDIFFENMPVVRFRQMMRNSDLTIRQYIMLLLFMKMAILPRELRIACRALAGTQHSYCKQRPLLHKNEMSLSYTFALHKTSTLTGFQTIPPCLYHPQLNLQPQTHLKINWELFGELSSEEVTNIAYQILVEFNFLLGTPITGIK